ncbi:MAG: hypothetical protein AAFQ51_08585 [Pseudomonadota bacterium]
MAETITLRVKGVPFRLTPFVGSKPYKDLAPNDPVYRVSVKRFIWAWNCAAQSGIRAQDPPKTIALNTEFLAISAKERDPKARKAQEKALLFDLLVATDLSPKGLGTEIASAFKPHVFAPNWARLVTPHKPDQRMEVTMTVTFLHVLAEPQVAKGPLKGATFLLRIPKGFDFEVTFGTPCRGKAPKNVFRHIDIPKSKGVQKLGDAEMQRLMDLFREEGPLTPLPGPGGPVPDSDPFEPSPKPTPTPPGEDQQFIVEPEPYAPEVIYDEGMEEGDGTILT